jgi:alpha-beta hydrolase superfamily lysophospholipase
MSIREVEFKSYNGRDTIKGWIYTPAKAPRCLVQIVHGLGEHSRRYMHMIMKLVDAGFAVCADDHAAHGKTAVDNNSWGDGGDKGYMTYIEDENSLRKLAQKELPGIPYFMFGHSWGSMIAREYLTHYGAGVKGAILCGTVAMRPEVPSLLEESRALIKAGKGNDRVDKLLVDMLKNFNNRYDNVLTPGDWIATDPGVVKDHAEDPFNSFATPNVYFMHDFVDLWTVICGKEWAAKVPTDIPLSIIAGDQDPVGNYGEGVYQAANWLWDTGHKKIKTKIYTGYRHEIHNEPDTRGEVEAGIVEFIEELL